MTRIYFHGPPEVEPDDGLCLVCKMLARGAELDATEAEWKRLAADGHDELQKWYPWEDRGVKILDAVVKGISDLLPQSGPIDLCWNHLGGLVNPKPASRLDGAMNVPIPPGLRRGRG